jgi:hypothetical protein
MAIGAALTCFVVRVPLGLGVVKRIDTNKRPGMPCISDTKMKTNNSTVETISFLDHSSASQPIDWKEKVVGMKFFLLQSEDISGVRAACCCRAGHRRPTWNESVFSIQ